MVPTVVCSGICNSVNIYPIMTYFISSEIKLSALLCSFKDIYDLLERMSIGGVYH